jgi:hypothetical protein
MAQCQGGLCIPRAFRSWLGARALGLSEFARRLRLADGRTCRRATERNAQERWCKRDGGVRRRGSRVRSAPPSSGARGLVTTTAAAGLQDASFCLVSQASARWGARRGGPTLLRRVGRGDNSEPPYIFDARGGASLGKPPLLLAGVRRVARRVSLRRPPRRSRRRRRSRQVHGSSCLQPPRRRGAFQ